MKVYHGSTAVIEKSLVGAGRNNLDFGCGFYVTDLEEQAISWASRPLNSGKSQLLNVYDFNKDKVLEAGFRYLVFENYDEKWLDFVISNRKGGSEWNKYDVVEGGIANDRIFNTIELYISELISKEEALARLQYEKPNNQICIHNQIIIDKYMRFVHSVEIGKELCNEK
jgi:hypothetical protein